MMVIVWQIASFLWLWTAFSPTQRDRIFFDENSTKVVLCIALMIASSAQSQVYRLRERVKALDGERF